MEEDMENIASEGSPAESESALVESHGETAVASQENAPAAGGDGHGSAESVADLRRDIMRTADRNQQQRPRPTEDNHGGGGGGGHGGGGGKGGFIWHGFYFIGSVLMAGIAKGFSEAMAKIKGSGSHGKSKGGGESHAKASHGGGGGGHGGGHGGGGGGHGGGGGGHGHH